MPLSQGLCSQAASWAVVSWEGWTGGRWASKFTHMVIGRVQFLMGFRKQDQKLVLHPSVNGALQRISAKHCSGNKYFWKANLVTADRID